MAGVRQLGWKAIPAVRSGYGADTLPDRYRSDGTFRSVRTAVHHVRHHDRSRRRCSFSCPDRPLVARAQQRYYPALPDHHRSSNTGHPTGSVHKRTPRLTGIFSTEWHFSRKRAARTVLTGMCYSVGSATRQGSSSLTRFIGQSAMTSRT